MGDLEPITRNEKLWSGEDLTPVTRKEMYIKHLYDETQVIPEYPVTREEMFILKAGEELHDVTIEQLTATENRTYSEEGVAYSPVIVNVPLPETAYLLKEIKDVEIASFNDGSDLPMPKLEVAIEPVQEGSGDPSPENVRPISGWDEVNVGVVGKNLLNANTSYNVVADSTWINTSCDLPKGTYTFNYNPSNENGQITFNVYNEQNERIYNNPGVANSSHEVTFTIDERASSIRSYSNSALTISEIQIEKGSTATTYEPYNGHTYTLDLDGTRYGGKVDLVSGVMTVEMASVDLGTLNWARNTDYTNPFFLVALSDKKISSEYLVCSIYPYGKLITGTTALNTMSNLTINAGNNSNALYIRDDSYTDAAIFKTAMNGVQLVYELATPLTIQLTPTVVKSLKGKNNVFADTGNILDLSYLAKEE